MYVFGFIVAAVVGCTAGSIDLTEGMFRHLVITGRSRLALYFARIPAGLAIVISIVAVGYTIVCAVCVFAAPTQLNYDGVNVPAGLSRPALDSWAASHADKVICNFNFRGGQGLNGPPPNVPCGGGQSSGPPPGTVIQTKGGGTITVPANESPAQIRAFAVTVANQDYADYHSNFLVPSTSLMVDVGLWIALEATIGFIVGLGLASLMGQRTVPVILLVILELILTPLFSRHVITHLLNAERGIVGVAMAHIEPGGLPFAVRGWRWRGWWRRWRTVRHVDTRVHAGGVVGDRGVARVLDRHRRVADGDQGRLIRRSRTPPRRAASRSRPTGAPRPRRHGRGGSCARACSGPSTSRSWSRPRGTWRGTC